VSDLYIPGVWSARYHRLNPSKKGIVNHRADVIFRKRTGLTRKINWKKEMTHVRTWLRIRDELMKDPSIWRSATSASVTYAKFTPLRSDKRVGENGWFPLESYSQSFARVPDGSLGDARKRYTADIVLIVSFRHAPAACRALAEASITGEVFDRAIIDSSSPKGGRFAITGHKVHITSFSTTGDQCAIALNPDRLTHNYTPVTGGTDGWKADGAL